MNNTLKDLFPLNQKKHIMNNRNQEKYKVNFANTNRLKNSSVITMQKLLNEEQWIVHIIHCHGELWLSIDIRLNRPIAEVYLILS